MSFSYDVFKDDITGLITVLGRVAMLVADTGGGIPVTAMLVDYGVRERDGQLIAVDDRRAFIVAAPGVAPDPEQHMLELDGEAFRIVSVRAVKPADLILYYDCQVRA